MTANKIKRIKTRAKRRKLLGTKVAPRAVLFVIGVLVILQVVFSSHLATQGAEINKLSRELEDLNKKNEQLSLQISSLGSLERVKQVASSELGMINSKSRIDYLKPSPSLASR